MVLLNLGFVIGRTKLLPRKHKRSCCLFSEHTTIIQIDCAFGVKHLEVRFEEEKKEE
jgi:hypothetical protein